jgi:hypothetical protein
VDAKAAKELAETSGNSFQCKVANYFRDNGWTVLFSPYYVDASTDKSRESDLIVEKSFPVAKYFVGAATRSVRLRLFVECKYVTEGAGAVFWMDPMDSMKARNLVFSRPPFSPDHPRHREQHYLHTDDSVAKLFASSPKKGVEENDLIFRALNQCLNGYIYNQGRSSMISLSRNEETTPLDYPMIIYSSFDHFYSTNVAFPGDPTPIEKNFLLEVDYAYLSSAGAAKRAYFLVDTVDFNKIDAFIDSMQIEMDAATYMLEQH